MKYVFLPAALLFSLTFTGCGSEGGGDAREGEVDPSEIIESDPDYEDSDPDGDGKISYEDQSTSLGGVTTRTTNYAQRADSLQTYGDTLVEPTYTDDEYEAAYSTSTTNPKNQVEGGVKPGEQQKKNN